MRRQEVIHDDVNPWNFETEESSTAAPKIAVCLIMKTDLLCYAHVEEFSST